MSTQTPEPASSQPSDKKEEAKTDGSQAAEAKPPIDPAVRVAQAEGIIRRNVLWSLGAGILPLPVVDVLALTAVQVKMLKELSDLYEAKFTEGVVKKIIASLASSLGSVGLGLVIGGSIAKFIPAVGTALGVATVPVLTGAFTLALGKVFLMHFESGGTVLNFDALAMRTYFQQEFEKAKEAVAQLQKNEQAQAGSKPAAAGRSS